MSRHSMILLPLVAAASLAAAQPADIEEIIVSADYRQSEINDIPASITVLDEKLITEKNARHLEDILLNAPNVNFSSGASRARFYQIRGIGERGQFAEPLNPSVGVMIDGVDFSGIGNAAMLYDVEQVEILLGPQGTRYGSNALAGLINLKSKAPTADLSYGMQVEAANYDSRGIAAYMSGPVNENLGLRLSVQKLESDGFIDNIFLNTATNGRNETTLRGKLSWQIDPDSQLDVTAALIDQDNGYDAFSLDNNRTTRSDQPGFDRQRSQMFSSTFSTGKLELIDLEAILAYADSNIDYGYDEDWTHLDFYPGEYSSTDHYFRQRDTLSAELRLLSNENSRLFGGRSDWVLGLYSLQQEVDLTRVYTWLPENFTSNYDIDRLAVFAETNTDLGASWSLDLGLRAERFKASYRDSNSLAFDPDDDLLGGKIALNYRTGNEQLIYASLSRGYKSGGFNTDGSLNEALREFDSEQLWNYELGFKGYLLNGNLQTRAAVFYMDRDDVQISSSTFIHRDDGSSEFIDFIGNAAAGSNYGLELSATLRATENLSLSGNLGLLKTEYEDFINSAGENLDGREQAHAPSYQYTLGADYLISPALSLNLNLQGRDAFYFSDSHDIESEAYDLINASLTYQNAEWRVTLWGRNLGDEDYFVRGFYFGNDPRDGYTAKGYTQLGEPRRFGVTVNLSY